MGSRSLPTAARAWPSQDFSSGRVQSRPTELNMVQSQPSLPVDYYFGKVIGFAAGFLIDLGTMPWAGAALGHIIDTFHFNFSIGADRSRRTKIPAWAVIVVSGT